MSTRQKRTLSFRGKLRGFFGGAVEHKRQCISSAYVLPIFRLAAAYPAAYLGLFLQKILSVFCENSRFVFDVCSFGPQDFPAGDRL